MDNSPLMCGAMDDMQCLLNMTVFSCHMSKIIESHLMSTVMMSSLILCSGFSSGYQAMQHRYYHRHGVGSSAHGFCHSEPWACDT